MKHAPLALVLVQVRWPEHGRLAADFKGLALAFGENLDEFPLFQEVTEQGFQITPEGVQAVPGESSFQWRSLDDVWVVHLSRTFLSLYCAPHENYRFAELALRLEGLVQLLRDVVKIQVVERLGVRYVDRVSDESIITDLPAIFDNSVLGMTGLSLNAGVELVNTLSQAIYKIDDINLHVRSGFLGPGETMDPAVRPATSRSWVLDLDAFEENRRILDPDQLAAAAGRLADVAYDFFKRVLKEQGELRLDGAR